MGLESHVDKVLEGEVPENSYWWEDGLNVSDPFIAGQIMAILGRSKQFGPITSEYNLSDQVFMKLTFGMYKEKQEED